VDFPSYSREELDQRARNLIRSRLRGADVSVGSDYDLWARILGALAWSLQQHGQTALRLLDCRKAFGDYLKQYAFEHGVGADITKVSVEATAATGKVIILSATAPSTLSTRMRPLRRRPRRCCALDT
jgi:uncharacterized phage protein gp47/JayE